VRQPAGPRRIDRPFDKVCQFLVDPASSKQWAFGLGGKIRRSLVGWIADSDGGVARCNSRRGTASVLSTIPSSALASVYAPMRLIAKGQRLRAAVYSLLRARHV